MLKIVSHDNMTWEGVNSADDEGGWGSEELVGGW